MPVSDLYPKEVINARGQIGKQYIYYIVKGNQRKRAYAVPSNPQTPRQQANRSFFKNGVEWWNNESDSFRQSYFDRVEQLNLKTTPFAEFIKDWYKEIYVANVIKSKQKGQTVCLNGLNNITITAVDMNKSVVLVNTFANSAEIAGVIYSVVVYGGQLTTATNLQIETALIHVANVKVYWQVIEYF